MGFVSWREHHTKQYLIKNRLNDSDFSAALINSDFLLAVMETSEQMHIFVFSGYLMLNLQRKKYL